MNLFSRTCLYVLFTLTLAPEALVQEKAVAAPDPSGSRAGRSGSGAATGSAVRLRAEEFPLSAVKLLASPFQRAMETDKAYLLRLQPDRLLAGFRREAGLPKKAEPYGGWETIPAEGRYSLAGQALGHYLSALSLMASATGDAECRRRAEYIVDELSQCQRAAGGGILCAFPESKPIFAELAAGQIKSDHLFNLNGGYVPLYVTHKVMAGLRDAWLLLGNREARKVLVRMADWLSTVVKDLTEAQIREMLETEHGGIMEVVADVYAITGDTRYLALARRLNHQSLFQPLARGEDVLTGLHANAQIPKVIGMERVYQLTGDPAFGRAARFFWDNVVRTRSFVIGGHGENEFFFAPDDFPTKGITSPTGPETCNTYNMIKLSRRLWLVEPSAGISDFIERALYNHILPSQKPERGGFVYFTSMRPGHYRTYSSDTEDFWCCTDTGMENHAKYGEFIYAHVGDRLWVDLLIPSELDWAEQGVRLRLDTRFPEDGKATLTISAKKPRNLELAIRCPGWLSAGAMRLTVNGSPEAVAAQPGAYAVLRRTWKTGDRIELEWPLTLRTEFLPRSKEWISVLWGPVVLAGELGREGIEELDFSTTHNYVATQELPVERAPVFAGTAADVLRKVKRVEGRPLAFRTEGLASPADVSLAPFYQVHRQRYAVYWKLTGDAAKHRRPAGPVRLVGHSLADDHGPFLGLGVSYFTALWRCKHDRARLETDLAFLSRQGFNYYRMLSMVGYYPAWEGLEIAPVPFTNRAGKRVEAWPDYWEQLSRLVDLAYDEYGLRTQITIFADAQLMPEPAARLEHLRKLLERVARGREHKILLLEVANEAWQNGFPDAEGISQLREFAKYLNDRTEIPVAITSNHDLAEGFERTYGGSAADLATWHFSRDRARDAGWQPVYDCWEFGERPGFPPAVSNEPIGPGSSVNSEREPIRLVMAAAFAYVAKLPAYVFHCEAGVFGRTRFEDTPAIGQFGPLLRLLPEDLPNWRRHDGKEPNAPLTVFAGGKPNRYWPEVASAADGCLRHAGSRKEDQFVCVPLGIRPGGLELEARHALRLTAYDPLTGEAVKDATLKAGERLKLPAGPGALLLKGTVSAPRPEN